MPFAHPSEDNSMNMEQAPSTLSSIGNGRYGLRRCMAETALGKLWWACDQQREPAGCEAGNVLVFTVLPALTQNSVFEQALRQVLPTYQKEVSSQPYITDNGREADGTRWLVISNIRGMLLAERMHELDDRGMPLAQAMGILEELSATVGNHRPEGVFGFLEPGAILFGEDGCRLLNAPAVAALRLASNGIIAHTGNHQTFHSGFISPEVALGDPPTSADDTFSLACIAYNLLQGHAPFGRQTTLEAAVRNAAPSVISKLKPATWVPLQQGMNLKRSVRQPTPTALLSALQPKRRSRLLLPAAALTVASVVAYASYHVLSGFMQTAEPPKAAQPISLGLPPATLPPGGTTTTPSLIGETAAPTPLDQTSVNAEATRLASENEARSRVATTLTAKAEADKLAADAAAKAASEAVAAEVANSEARRQEVDKLLQEAETALQQGKLTNPAPGQPSALEPLRKILALDPANAAAKKLAARMVDDQHSEASILLAAGKTEDARKLLLNADKLISELALTDSLQRQVRLESQLEQGNRDTQKVQTYLDSARNAMQYGNLMQGDGRSESAVAYISTLLQEQPNHPEAIKLLKDIARTQQDQALSALRKNNPETARSLLDNSQQLIGKYLLDDLVEQQLSLEKRYRDTGQMGVFPSGQEPAAKTDSKPDTAASSNRPTKPETAPAADSKPAPKPETKPEPRPEPKPEPEPVPPEPAEKTAITPPTDTAPPKVVTVPPDVPVAEPQPVPANDAGNLPPVQIDIPVVPPPPAEPVPAPVQDTAPPVPAITEPNLPPPVFEIPADTGKNTGGSFTPDVPGLMEVPLDAIKENLPPARNAPTD